MSRPVDDVLKDALALAEDQRAQVAAALLVSLDGDVDPNAETEWAAEIERRLARIAAAQSHSVSINESLVRLYGVGRNK